MIGVTLKIAVRTLPKGAGEFLPYLNPRKGFIMAKQGGKGKTSSPSRQASHKRATLHADARKQKRIARHAKRQNLTAEQTRNSLVPPTFPRVRQEKPAERVIFSGKVSSNLEGEPVFFRLVHGVCTDISLYASDLNPGNSGTIVRVNPISGVQTPV